METKITREKAEIILAEVIDVLYILCKKDFCDYKNKTHKLGRFKESVKDLFHSMFFEEQELASLIINENKLKEKSIKNYGN